VKKKLGILIIFFLAGEYPDISSNSFAELYNIEESFILAPHSLSCKVLVFHIENWWDESNELYYKFKFTGGKKYQVYIGFETNLNEQSEEVKLFKMTTFGSVDRLDRKGADGYWWDFWSIEEY